MKKHAAKLIWTLAFGLVIFLLVNGFSLPTQKSGYDADTTENCEPSKSKTGLNISNLSRHILDFNK